MSSGCQHCKVARAAYEVRTGKPQAIETLYLCADCAADWRAKALSGAPEFGDRVPLYQHATPLRFAAGL